VRAAACVVLALALGMRIAGKRNVGTASAWRECARGGDCIVSARASGATLMNTRLRDPTATNSRAIAPRRNAIKPKLAGRAPQATAYPETTWPLLSTLPSTSPPRARQGAKRDPRWNAIGPSARCRRHRVTFRQRQKRNARRAHGPPTSASLRGLRHVLGVDNSDARHRRARGCRRLRSSTGEPLAPACSVRMKQKRRGRDLNPRGTFQHLRDFQSRSLDRSDTSPGGEAG
jgi:hypothetical protein